MKTKFIYLLFFTALVTSAPSGWEPPDDNEECRKLYTDAMVRCLSQFNQVPEKVTLKCRELNHQNGCEVGMRQVIYFTNKCVSTKCIKNSSGGEICKDGEVPYNGGCHRIGSSHVCNDFTPKRTLEVDIFGNVSCKCRENIGLLNFNGDCYSESSFSPCNQDSSTKQQLIRY